MLARTPLACSPLQYDGGEVEGSVAILYLRGSGHIVFTDAAPGEDDGDEEETTIRHNGVAAEMSRGWAMSETKRVEILPNRLVVFPNATLRHYVDGAGDGTKRYMLGSVAVDRTTGQSGSG